MNFKKRKVIITSLLLLVSLILFKFICIKSTLKVKPKIEPVVEAVYALGTVKSDKTVNIRFGMNSVITRFYVKEGDSVSKNDPLLITDSFVTFRSPISGVITAKNSNENEVVTSGQTVLTITDMKSLYIKLSLDQETIISVKKGMKTEISFENLRETKVKGEVESIYQSGSEFVVKVRPASMPDAVLPEMTCDTAIIIRENPSAVLIPAAAITNGSVKFKRQGSFQTLKIKTRAVDNGWVEVLDGAIKPDDIIYYSDSKNSNNKRNRDDPVFR